MKPDSLSTDTMGVRLAVIVQRDGFFAQVGKGRGPHLVLGDAPGPKLARLYGSRHVPVYAQHDYGGQLTGEAHSQTVTLVDGVGLDDPRQEQSADLPESRLVEHFPVVAQLHLAVQVVDSGSAPLLAGERRDAAPAA